MKTCILLAVITGLLTACGPNAQQKAAEQKAQMDSVIAATKALEAYKAELRSKAKELEQSIDQQEEKLKEAIAALQGEKARMESIQSFHLLRTSSEKAQQIRDQSMVMLNIEENIQTLRKNITDLESAKQSVERELKQLN